MTPRLNLTWYAENKNKSQANHVTKKTWSRIVLFYSPRLGAVNQQKEN
jgi:hypothetical protein